MSLSVGIVGLPNVGKSTLFNALTKKSVPAENYPFCTIDPSVGIVPVPDPRLATLSAISGSQKIIPAVVEFVDIAGLVKGASEGEGLGNQFLAHIRETDMIAEVVRIFEDENVIHVSGRIDPIDDISVINLELILSDLETITKRLGNLERSVKQGDKAAIAEKSVMERVRQHLEAGKLAVSLPLEKEELVFLKSMHLLSAKQFLYVLNKKSGAQNIDELNDERWEELLAFMESTKSEYVIVDAGVEHDLKDLAEEDKTEFRREYGAQDSGVDALIRAAYHRLGLMSYFTTGEAETRAWTVPVGATGPQAGAAIHTDFEDKYIRAQVVSFDDLAKAGSIAVARDTGKLRTEGKEYIVKNGDVIEFMI